MTVRTAQRILLVAVAVFFMVLVFAPAFAHEGEAPESTMSDALREAHEFCDTETARNAWGAYARGLGAPNEIKTAPMETVRTLFFAKPEQLDGKLDGIYIVEGLSFQDLLDYSEAATAGWNDADTMLKKDPTVLNVYKDYELLIAVYREECMRQVGPKQ